MSALAILHQSKTLAADKRRLDEPICFSIETLGLNKMVALRE